VSEQLREAIRKSGRSLNQIGKDAGVGSDRLSRFMREERHLRSDAIDRLCTALGLRLSPSAPSKAKAEEE
jgi:DNA-binding phage protein